MRTEQIASRQNLGGFFIGTKLVCIGPGRIEQVRKGGLPPLFQSKQRRGQAALPDLFSFD